MPAPPALETRPALHHPPRTSAVIPNPTLRMPSFWDWADLPVRPEAELKQQVAVVSRLLRNSIEHAPSLHHALGAASFALQSYARHEDPAALKAAQKGTVAGFIEVWRRPGKRPVPRDALLGLVITLVDLQDLERAERVYQQLSQLYPGSRELAWAHLRMAEQAQRAGHGELAARRYSEALALLPSASRAFAHARASLQGLKAQREPSGATEP